MMNWKKINNETLDSNLYECEENGILMTVVPAGKMHDASNVFKEHYFVIEQAADKPPTYGGFSLDLLTEYELFYKYNLKL